jgi:hypothetical protein
MLSDQEPIKDQKNDEKHPEAFPESTSMPGGWNLTDLLSDQAGAKDESEDAKNKKDPTLFDRDKMKFPEPRTYPKGWKIEE